MTIQVGAEVDTQGGIFQFIPNSIMAPNGTVVNFRFSGIPGNHSVTQASFNSPCQPLAGGFDSGWVEILQNTTGGTPLPSWNLTITNDQIPIWFFCKQLLPSPHCPAGMVGVINVQPGANSLSAFRSKAQSDNSPGQEQGGLVGLGASASADPEVPSAFATLFKGTASATATAPAGGSGSGSAGGAGPTNSAPSGGAVSLGLNMNLLVLVLGVLAGGALVN
ncbi:hypothetical protein R3P38DRAFT_2511893 [Favolaschia claudopus]|uniref:Uncharacterized protein n=1 Tax=Favolaschia claudopus TaxID=2862362 RepID=A0AAW0CPF6_9AGAR